MLFIEFVRERELSVNQVCASKLDVLGRSYSVCACPFTLGAAGSRTSCTRILRRLDPWHLFIAGIPCDQPHR
jgi:hypothetical protein